METNTVDKVLDLAGNGIKLAANISEKKPEPKPKSDANSNASTGNQNVHITMDTGKKREPKPIEKHIHEFPDNRPLTNEECELALKKAQMDFDLKKSEQSYYQKANDREWQHQMEVEKKNEKRRKIRNIIAGVLGVFGAGAIGYSIWTDIRDHKGGPVAAPQIPENGNTNPDGPAS